LGPQTYKKTTARVQPSRLIFYIFLILTATALWQCANPVSPTGGAKDTTPPRVLSSDPPNYAIRVKNKSFKIDFNEFITLKNPVSEIFISPPLKNPLDTRLRGKSLIIKTDDSLSPNTTYSITFGNAITDLTEGNVLTGYNFVFSTGDYVDSLSLQGNVRKAFDLQPQKDVFAELYIDNNDTIPYDSLPFKVAPYYITKTDEQGNFIFHNLQNKPFKLFALSDQNGDLIFNQLSEKIAFCDSLALPFFYNIPKPDTAGKDSIMQEKQFPLNANGKIADSIHRADSLHKADSLLQSFSKYPSYPLFLFEEVDSIQRLVNATSPKEGLTQLVFRFPVSGLQVIPLNFDSVAPWKIEEYSRNKDTVRLWITRPDTDSLIARVMLGNKIIDTIQVEIAKKESSKPSAKEKPKQLTITNSASGSGLNQYKNKLILTFSYPLKQWDFRRIWLLSAKDTLHPEMYFTDSLKRRVAIIHKWEEDLSYKILIPDSVFYGIQGYTHDTVIMEFKTRSENDFGNLVLTMNMEKRPGNYIIQLLNEKETLVYEEHFIQGSEKVFFNFMTPGKYKVKAIHDRNRNNHWDTGNYRLKIQPEEVMYLPKLIEIRANWDVEESWN